MGSTLDEIFAAVEKALRDGTFVPKARLAELEKDSDLLRGIVKDWTAVLNAVPEAEAMIPDGLSAQVVAFIGNQRARIAALESSAVAAEALARECLLDGERYDTRSLTGDIIRRSKERLAARASAKGEASR